ncbi:MAG: TonB-dependent receptor [Saprospiraceae bacterium]
MQKYMLLGIFLGLHALCLAQRITVTDRETGQPLELVTLSDSSLQWTVTTNAQGQADLTTFQGSPKIMVTLLGYQTQTFSYGELAKSPFQIQLQPLELSLNQVVVSATRWKQFRSDVPSRVIAITPADVALQQPQTAADMLGQSGEVFIQKSQQGGGSPMIRGFATNRLLYSVDGVRMNTAIFRSGNLQNVISIDPFAIENTEVFFGPGSVVYGSDAIGGVMSFQTLTPLFSTTENPQVQGHATARFASANQEKTGHFDVGVGWKKWAMISSLTTSDYSDLRMGSYGPDDYLRPYFSKRINGEDVVIDNDQPQVQTPSGYSQINLMQKVRFAPNAAWDIQYGFHHSASSEYSRYDRLLRTRNGEPRSAEWNYGPQLWTMHNLSASHSATTRLYDQMTLRVALQQFEESRIDRDWNDPVRRTRTEKVEAWSINADFLKNFNNQHRLLYGTEGVVNDVASNGVDQNIETGDAAAGPSRYPQSTWSTYGLYAVYQWKPVSALLVQAGGRYGWFNLDADLSNNLTFYPFSFSQFNVQKGALTGNLGAVYHAAQQWELGVNLSSGFRAPNVDDAGKVFDSEPGSVVVPNPDLEPEYAYNASVDVAKVWGNRVKIDVCFYYTFLQQALVRRNFTSNGQDSIVYGGELSQVQAIQNAAKATVYGLQAGIEVKVAPGLLFVSQFNFQEGEEELDNGQTSPLRHAAPWFGLTKLTYKRDALTFQFYGTYSGAVPFDELSEEGKATDYIYAKDANGNPYSPAWYTLNAKALYNLNASVSISAGVENLTDQRYRPYSSGISAAGRNVLLAFLAQF